MEFQTVIGLEVHVELNTKSKIFCGCSTEFGAEPNTEVCPVCLGLPGALPVLNKKVVDYAIKTGLALNCDIARYTMMDRKNYFYPDSPKNYQITQDRFPICREGNVEIELGNGEKKSIGIERIHMEDDAGKLIHNENETFIDFNRAGVPLLEIVSKPHMNSAEEAILYVEKLKSILTCIGVSDCKMEEGSLRVDLNISVKPVESKELGVRAEIKNLNSFKFLEKAVNYERERQIKAIENNEVLFMETRRWDEKNNITLSMRNKEEAQDYRYFPEGDILEIIILEKEIEDIKSTIPELEHEKKYRFIKEYNLSNYDASVLSKDYKLAHFFEKTVKSCEDSKAAVNWIMGDISYYLNENKLELNETKLKAENLGELIKLIKDKVISSTIGKKILVNIIEEGKSPKDIVKEKGLIQNNDEKAILEMIRDILNKNQDKVKEYLEGKSNLYTWFVGQIMKESRGKANPSIVNKLLKSEIENNFK